MSVPHSKTWNGGWAVAYKRVEVPSEPLRGEELTAAMVGIGMNFAADAAAEPD